MRALALSLVGLLLLAGCLSPAALDEAEFADASAVLAELGAVPDVPGANATGAWYVANVMALPEGGLAGFEWTVPADAVVPWQYNEEFGEDEQVVALEIALLARGADVTSWGILTFEEMDGMLLPGYGYAAIPVEATVYGPTASSFELYESYTNDPVFARLVDVEAGSVVRFLAFATSDSAQEIAIAFRTLESDPEPDDEPAKSAESFVAALNGTAPRALARIGTGAGFAFHAYSDVLLGSFAPGFAVGIEIVSGSPTYEWSAPPEERALGGAHSLAAGIAGVYDHGYALAFSEYFSMAYGHATYASSTSLKGSDAAEAGASPDVAPLAFIPPAGRPSVFSGGAGDGEGAAQTSLAVERVFVPGYLTAGSIMLLELGATLDELIGENARPNVVAGATDLTPLALVEDPDARPMPGTRAFASLVRLA